MQIELWLGFCLVALMASATPGPAAMMAVAVSLQYGVKRSLFAIAGNVTGLFVMSAASVVGLSTLVMHSAFAFTLVKLLGAIYLIYLGIKIWRRGLTLTPEQQQNAERRCVKRLYLQGLTMALTNPKAIAFTTALFPQFIDVSSSLLPQFTILVLSFMVQSFVCLTAYGLLARIFQTRCKQHTQNKHSVGTKNTTAIMLRSPSKWLGAAFIGVGCAVASSSR